MSAEIFRFPFERTEKNRTWIRFKRIDFELDNNNIIQEKGSNTDVVYLYLPGSIQIGDEASYDEAALGFAGTAVENAIKSGALGPVANSKELARRISGALDFAGSGYSDLIKTGKNIATGKKVNAAILSKVMERFRVDNTRAGRGVKSALKYTANPHTRATFDSVGIRKFSFDFNMVPNSRKEAEQMEKIIKFFRTLLYPDFAESDNNLTKTLIYKFPSMLQIDMFYQLDKDAKAILERNTSALDILSNEYGIEDIDASSGIVRIGPKIQKCYLTGVNTTYDPESTMAWHFDGKPLSTNLSVSVQEDRTLSRNDVSERGY